MAKITKQGFFRRDLVDLLDKLTGQVWIPASQFNDVGNAELGLIGSSKPTGMLFQQTTAEEIDTSLLFPKDIDVSKAVSAYVYWSSADENGTDVVWDIDVRAVAAGDDIGVAVTNATTTDTDSTTADDLNISDAISIAADTMAANSELLFINVRREAADAGDDLDADAAFYGIRLDYTPLPEVKT